MLHRHLAERGLLSFLRLLRAFQLNVIKRNHVYYQQQSGFLGSPGQHFSFLPFFDRDLYRDFEHLRALK